MQYLQYIIRDDLCFQCERGDSAEFQHLPRTAGNYFLLVCYMHEGIIRGGE
jgi:hypothetical protein